jgi:hypothetical protein
MNWTTTSHSTQGYHTSQPDHSATEVRIEPIGEMLTPLSSDALQSPVDVFPMVLTVIDGEIRVVKDEAPPGARLPNPASGLFKLANAPALTDSPA